MALALSFSGCDPREWFVCSLGYCGYPVDDVAPARPAQVAATPGDRQVTLRWSAGGEPDLFGFSTLGGTLRAGGRFTQTLRSGKLLLRGNALRGRGARKLPAACRRLR